MKNETSERIKNRRIELNLSQEELGKRIGVDRTTIAKWEAGDNNLRQSKAVALAKALNCSVTWLMGLESKEIPNYVPGTVEIIDLYSRATPEQRQAVLNLLRSFVSNQE